MIRKALLLFSSLLLVAACSGTDSDNTDNNSSDGDTSAQRGAPSSCVGECPDGQFCFNGVCAIGCNSDGDCADNQYCATETDRLCHNKQVTECGSDADCAGDQVCNQGLCAAAIDVEGSCDPSPDGKDGCGEYAVCVDREGPNECYTMPKCGADGTCPTGQIGAVCNEGDIPNKAEICLLGLCKAESDCPGGWSCMKATSSQTLGTCLPTGGGGDGGGGTGSTCKSDADCESGSCVGGGSGIPGVCE